MAYKRKTIDRWDIESNWGYGWDVECSEYTRMAAKEMLACYRDNVKVPLRIVKRREPITV